ncbi:hypothetical protein Taro_040849, partial [Colocasia esculenta]|nr:hypothetical protein [Colocasia esculenta]
HFQLLTGARGKIVMRVAVADRAGNDGSDGGSCEKLLGVFMCGFRGCGALSLRCWSCLATDIGGNILCRQDHVLAAGDYAVDTVGGQHCVAKFFSVLKTTV